MEPTQQLLMLACGGLVISVLFNIVLAACVKHLCTKNAELQSTIDVACTHLDSLLNHHG